MNMITLCLSLIINLLLYLQKYETVFYKLSLSSPYLKILPPLLELILRGSCKCALVFYQKN